MESKKYVTLTEKNFREEVLERATPVLVDFWAPWCGPCRAFAPTIDQLAEEFDSQAIVGKLNVDDHQQVAARYGIQSIPTLMIFSNGKILDKIVGAVPKNVLAQRVTTLLKAA